MNLCPYFPHSLSIYVKFCIKDLHVTLGVSWKSRTEGRKFHTCLNEITLTGGHRETFWHYDSKQCLGQVLILLRGYTISGLVGTELMKSALGCTHFPKIYKPPQNPKRQDDMKTVSQWGPTVIAKSEPGHVPGVVWAVWAGQLSRAGSGGQYRVQNCRLGDLAPGIYEPLNQRTNKKLHHTVSNKNI